MIFHVKEKRFFCYICFFANVFFCHIFFGNKDVEEFVCETGDVEEFVSEKDFFPGVFFVYMFFRKCFFP